MTKHLRQSSKKNKRETKKKTQETKMLQGAELQNKSQLHILLISIPREKREMLQSYNKNRKIKARNFQRTSINS